MGKNVMYREGGAMPGSVHTLNNWIQESDNIVFFGGAGVSTESGIPDFRSTDGLYSQKWDYPPETILSHSFFNKNPEEFYRFYRAKLVFEGVKPNAAHMRLAELERVGKIKAVITQNVDGLHQAAGSENVLELHGSANRAYCTKCRQSHEPSCINTGAGVPRCKYCGGILRPDVVLYEESLDSYVMKRAIEYISAAEIVIVGGTSLVVYPAASMIEYYSGKKLVLINRTATPYDSRAGLVINDNIGKMFEQLAVNN